MSYAYHIIKSGEEKGPFTFDELIRQHLDIDTRLLSPAASNWEEACDVPELYSYVEGLGVYFPAKSNLASFWWRLLAYSIDSLIIGTGAYLIFYKLTLSGIIESRFV